MAVILSTLVADAAGHGSMIMPPSRNAIDASPGMAWADGKHPATGVIEPYTCQCENGTSVCSSGQGCFWFSQGVSVGCTRADGNGTRFPNLDHCAEERPPAFNPLTMEGALLPKYRTVNLNSTPGSLEDIWKYNPWRAPGRGPLADPCGMAGGNTVGVFNAGEYNTTKFAKQGDLGTRVLPKRTDLGQTTWRRGTVERTRWQITAAHVHGALSIRPPLVPACRPYVASVRANFCRTTHTLAGRRLHLPDLPAELGPDRGMLCLDAAGVCAARAQRGVHAADDSRRSVQRR